MEPKLQILNNGQQIITDDVNLLGANSALADDRVFAELLRMAPFNTGVSRGVLTATSGLIAQPSGSANASIQVQPFRAFIGSRTAVTSDAKANWRDIRSAISIGTTALNQTIAFAANASGNPRFDLVYAAVSVDANASTVTRKVKDPASKVIAGTNVVTQVATVVSLAVLAGTAAAAPAFPSTPTDAGTTYYIPIAYVRIPTGFTASSTILIGDIVVIAPALRMSSATGGQNFSIASRNTGLVSSTFSPTTTGGQYLQEYLPPVSGNETLFFTLAGTPNNAIIDSSRDWRYRYFRWTVGSMPTITPRNTPDHIALLRGQSVSSSGGPGAGPVSGTTGSPYQICFDNATNANNRMYFGIGSSFAFGITGHVMTLDTTIFPGTSTSTCSVFISVDSATGNLVFSFTGSFVQTQLYIWLDATPRMF